MENEAVQQQTAPELAPAIPQPHGGALRHFQPGNKASPGRPKRPTFKTIAERLLAGKTSIIGADGSRAIITKKEAMILLLIDDAASQDEDPAIRLKALNAIFDRLEGKATQPVDVTSDGEKIESPFLALPIEDQAELLRRLKSKNTEEPTGDDEPAYDEFEDLTDV